jgi:UDP-glucose 4-epimerase
VSDVVRAVIGLLDEPKAVGEVFNVGSEEEISIAELAQRVITATGSASTCRTVPYGEVYGDQYEDMLRRAPDTSKIRRTIGWRPQHDLDAIVKRTIEYAHEAGPETLLAE